MLLVKLSLADESFEDAGESSSLAVLSRHKRSFGGQEPINWTLVIGNVLGPGGWTPLFCGANLDLIFHVSGYVVLGKLFFRAVRLKKG